MHFVKKVATSDEEKALKAKQRAIKLKTFCAARDRIFDKRAKGELDDEILELTQKILEKNPDIYTFWNIRRDTIEQKIANWTNCQNNDASNDECVSLCEKKINDLLLSELFITQTCVEANPKSYSAWFQRGWILKKQKNPDIVKDLGLCRKALQMDCRNFHVWDHRRIVAKLGNLSEEEELKFSNDLIRENFSNYSAWHYRATLLQRTQHEKTGRAKFTEQMIADEIEKASHALYTDPDDQSAWIYCKWLIEMSSPKDCFRPHSYDPSVPISVTFHGNSTTVVMSKACTIHSLLSYVQVDDNAEWKAYSALSNNAQSSRVWKYLSSNPIRVNPNLDGIYWIHTNEIPYVNRNLLHLAFDCSPHSSSEAIEKLAQSCKELITLEPKKMWPLYMYTICLMESDPIDRHDEIISNLNKLATEIDGMRKEIYKSIASSQILNSVLRSKSETGKSVLDDIIIGKETGLAIRRKGIYSLEVDLLAGLVTELDISGNEISSIDDIVLPNLTHLTLNENPIQRLGSSFSLENIEFLSVSSCPISSLSDILPTLSSMSHLSRFMYCETELVDKTKELSNSLPDVRLIPHYL